MSVKLYVRDNCLDKRIKSNSGRCLCVDLPIVYTRVTLHYSLLGTFGDEASGMTNTTFPVRHFSAFRVNKTK